MKYAFILAVIALFLLLSPVRVQAQVEATPAALSGEVTLESVTAPTSSESAALEASASAQVEQIIQDKRNQDITESTGVQKSKLAQYLDANPIAPLSWYNVLQHAIRGAINRGLPANIVVLVILFPIITALISASRHLIGLQGFGIYIPAVLSVAFASTGISTGVVIFIAVLLASVLFKAPLQKLKLQYLPRTALLLWAVSLFILLLLILATYAGFNAFLSLNIFPILIIMLLIENFMETQLSSTRNQALQLTIETLLIATVCSLLIGWDPLQKAVLLNPEFTVIGVALFNVITGKYSGLRLLEYIRFRSIMEQ
ncbi:hypothetical protein KA082_02060 [Candidatus Woesebacteria bacterium]|nr:hypothetical protein [Candidatus Woesebacteria bacterium]